MHEIKLCILNYPNAHFAPKTITLITLCTLMLLLLLYLTKFYCMCLAHASCLGGTNIKDWNTLLQNQLKWKAIFFQISCLACVPLPKFVFFSKPQVPSTQLTHRPKRKKRLKFSIFDQKDPWKKTKIEKGP